MSPLTVPSPLDDSKLFRRGEDLIPPLCLSWGFLPVLKNMLRVNQKGSLKCPGHLKESVKDTLGTLFLPDFMSASDI